MMITNLIFGALMVLAGRNLFWLCVGIIGFLTGAQFATSLGYSNDWMILLLAIAFGCLGALLAICFEWVMVVFGAGFLGGGYLLTSILPSLAGQETNSWIIFTVGGIVGMCLMIIIFDWTLIIVSSLLGATLIANAFHTTEVSRELLFIGSLVTGILVQYLILRHTVANAD